MSDEEHSAHYHCVSVMNWRNIIFCLMLSLLSAMAAPGILFPLPWQKHKVGWKFHPFKTALAGKYSVLVGPLVSPPKLPLKFIKDGPGAHALRDDY